MEDAFEEGQGSCRAVEPMMDDEKQERDIKERRGERANKKERIFRITVFIAPLIQSPLITAKKGRSTSL
jgi:hypothetical protein